MAAQTVIMNSQELFHCKCHICGHESRKTCILEKCECCELEDTFSILARVEAEEVLRRKAAG